MIKSKLVRLFLCFILLFSLVNAVDEIFTKEFYSKGTEITYTTFSITEQNPYCLMGLIKYCEFIIRK